MDHIKKKAYERLQALLSEADSATYDWTMNGKSTEWKRNVEGAMRRLFDSDSHHLEAFKDVRYSLSVWTDTTPDSAHANAFKRGIVGAQAVIRAAIQDVEDYELAIPESSVANADSLVLSLRPSGEAGAFPPQAKSVFIVHGHDLGMKDAVARFVERLDLEAIVLSEQANAGDTVIEKFERHAGVKFAIVLLSPDDVGAKAPGPGEPKARRANLKPRARQNAVLELGFFLGALKRKNVCAIVRGRIELPSDIHGVMYVPFEGDQWKIELVKELKEAGFQVDANQAFWT